MNHDSYSDAYLRELLSGVRTIAVVGISPRPIRPSHSVAAYLKGVGYRIIPINPGHAGGRILGEPVFARLADVPEPIDMVDIFRRTEALAGVVAEAIALKPRPRVVWMQLGLRDDAAAARAETAGIAVVMDHCSKIEHGRLIGLPRG